MTQEFTHNTPLALKSLGLDFTAQTVAIIGLGGIGTEVARLCALAGARLLLVDSIPGPPKGLRDLSSASQHRWLTADLLRPDARDQVLEFIQEASALVVTAALFTQDGLEESGSPSWRESFDKVFQINLEAGMHLSMQMLQIMKKRQIQGRIVLLGSLAARTGGLLSGAQYAASKGAIHTFVRWLATRAAPDGIAVNGVAPGVTLTPMISGCTFDAARIPAGRAAEPIEIARVITFLASPAASYLHGQIIDVNGGAWYG